MTASTLALPFVTFSLSCACGLGQSLVPLVLRRIEDLGEQGHALAILRVDPTIGATLSA
jgi:hypothetical protein